MKKKKSALIAILLALFIIGGYLKSSEKKPATLRIAFYNVENLFDPEDDPRTDDDDFTPDGENEYTYDRYYDKSTKISQVLQILGEGNPLSLIGLCEVENERVLRDLINQEPIEKHGYKYIHYDSPDHRGIDVAALYNPAELQLLDSKNIRVRIQEEPGFTTRDMLICSFVLPSNDTLFSLFCHWPSRSGGQRETEYKRVEAARTARRVIDSILLLHPQAKIVVAGDFNDEHYNASIKDFLGSLENPQYDFQLHNLMAKAPNGMGSHRYRGQWAFLDQIMVSPSLYPLVYKHKAKVLKKDFLLEEDKRFPGMKPFRSYLGPHYNAGFSDHLPVYTDIQLELEVTE